MRRFRSVYIITILLVQLFFISETDAQPAFYSQPLASGEAMNPALAGVSAHKYYLGGIYQNRQTYDTTNVSTWLFRGAYRIDFDYAKSGYGQKYVDESPFSLAIGFLTETRRSDSNMLQYRSAYLPIAIHYKIARKHLISVSFAPGLFQYPNLAESMSVSYIPNPQPITYRAMKSKYQFDYGIGILIGLNKMECWTDDQLYKFMIGASYWHNGLSDTIPMSKNMPTGTINVHASYLWEINEQWGAIPLVQVQHQQETVILGEFTLMYRRHWAFFDRARVGVGYRSAGQIIPSAGFRIFGGKKRSFGADLAFSYDISIQDQKESVWHKKGFEISLLLSPVLQCWSNSPCSNHRYFAKL